jgi:hypothetical protein
LIPPRGTAEARDACARNGLLSSKYRLRGRDWLGVGRARLVVLEVGDEQEIIEGDEGSVDVGELFEERVSVGEAGSVGVGGVFGALPVAPLMSSRARQRPHRKSGERWVGRRERWTARSPRDGTVTV